MTTPYGAPAQAGLTSFNETEFWIQLNARQRASLPPQLEKLSRNVACLTPLTEDIRDLSLFQAANTETIAAIVIVGHYYVYAMCRSINKGVSAKDPNWFDSGTESGSAASSLVMKFLYYEHLFFARHGQDEEVLSAHPMLQRLARHIARGENASWTSGHAIVRHPKDAMRWEWPAPVMR